MIQPKNTTMDLISAKVEAAKLSRIKKQKMYINVDGEGECTVSEKPKGAITAYNNGSEVALESSIEIPTTQPKTKKQKVMSDVKAPVKKATAKKEVKKVAVKTERPSNLIGKATTVFLTQAQWNKFAEKGNIRDNVSKAVIKTFGL